MWDQVREIVPIPSDTPTIETVSEYCSAWLREAFKRKKWKYIGLLPKRGYPPPFSEDWMSERMNEFIPIQYKLVLS